MEQIVLIKDLGLGTTTGGIQRDLEVNELFNGPFRRLIEVRLKNHAVLKRHKADVPITVLCLSGLGTFKAGIDLKDSQNLMTGTLLTLEADIEHEVVADPDLHILVTKFKAE